MAWGYPWDFDGVFTGGFYDAASRFKKGGDIERIRLAERSRINIQGGAICLQLF